jgi:uncharacterized SAM-binding protein YcdF (DUF218 family)
MQEIYSLMNYLLYPEVWILLVLLLACLTSWTTHCSRSVRFLLVLLTVLYYGFTTRPLTQVLVDPLETYAQPPLMLPQSDAIVLFANDAPQLEAFSDRPTIVGTGIAHLLVCGLTYVRARTAPLVILAEGLPGSYPRDAMPTTVLQDWAVRLGYPQEAIVTATPVGPTHERALAVKQLLGSKNRILLLDEALHLPRSTAAFGKVGFTVTPVPCDAYHMSTLPWSLYAFIPNGRSLNANREAIHEYIGLFTYWLRGLI